MVKHVTVLKGGWSAEREVSLNSGAACEKALREAGYEVSAIDMAPGMTATALVAALEKAKPDVVFNALHGRFGEDGCVQGLLNLMKISYTHSGLLASSIAMDKPMAKRVFAAAGLRCPQGKVMTREEIVKGDPLPRPFVIKPACEGSSVGVHIITQEDNRPLEMIVASSKLQVASEKEDPVCNLQLATYNYLVEEYIPGRELTVAVLDEVPLGVTEIRPISGFYDYENKYTDGKTEHLCPAPLEKAQYEEVMSLALRAHFALGCRGLSRADFRYDGKAFYLLEVNTQPGMTALSLSPEIAAYAGISFANLVKRLVEGAGHGT